MPDIPAGTVFSRLTVKSAAEPYRRINGSQSFQSNCECECGNSVIVRNDCLRGGVTKSCGCHRRDRGRAVLTTHGLSWHPLFTTWCLIIDRCTKPTCDAYPEYGGRGITISDAWKDSFLTFVEDMGPRPSKDHSVDRINNDGGYSKDNCRWATQEQQCNNKRTNRFITLYGLTLTATQWGRISLVDGPAISNRISSGWSEKRAVWTPIKRRPSQRKGMHYEQDAHKPAKCF